MGLALAVVDELMDAATIEEPGELLRRPDEAETVERIVGRGAIDLRAFLGLEHVVERRSVDREVKLVGKVADELHQVDLAAERPGGVFYVGPEGPESGPDAASARDSGGDLDFPAGESMTLAGGEAGGGIVGFLTVFGPRFLAGGDDQLAVLDAGVFTAVFGVVLGFVVAQEADLVVPLGGVGRPVAVELVAPGEFPIRRGIGGDGGGVRFGGGRDRGGSGDGGIGVRCRCDGEKEREGKRGEA